MEEKKNQLSAFVLQTSIKSPHYHNENTSSTQQVLVVTLNFMHIVDILSEKKY